MVELSVPRNGAAVAADAGRSLRLVTSQRICARLGYALCAGALLGLLLVAGLLFVPADPGPSSQVRFERFIALPRTGLLTPLDYVALSGHHLYVAGLRSGTLFDVDLTERDRPTTMASTDGGAAHAVVFVPGHDLGFLTKGGVDVIDAFDPRTLRVIKRIAVAADPDAALYDPATRRLYVAGGRSQTATLVDVDSLSVSTKIALPGHPEFAALDAATGLVYQNLNDRDAMAIVDLAKGVVVETKPLPGCKSPTGLAIDGVGRRLFVVCSGNARMVVFDIATFLPIASISVGQLADSVAFDGSTHRIYVACGAGELTVVSQQTRDVYRVVDRIRTQLGAHTIAVDAATHAVFVAYAGIASHPRIAVFDGSAKPASIE